MPACSPDIEMNQANPKLAALVDLAIDAIRDLVTDPDTPPSIRLRAAKLILDSIPDDSIPDDSIPEPPAERPPAPEPSTPQHPTADGGGPQPVAESLRMTEPSEATRTSSSALAWRRHSCNRRRDSSRRLDRHGRQYFRAVSFSRGAACGSLRNTTARTAGTPAAPRRD